MLRSRLSVGRSPEVEPVALLCRSIFFLSLRRKPQRCTCERSTLCRHKHISTPNANKKRKKKNARRRNSALAKHAKVGEDANLPQCTGAKLLSCEVSKHSLEWRELQLSVKRRSFDGGAKCSEVGAGGGVQAGMQMSAV